MSSNFSKGLPVDTDVNLAADSDLLIPSQKAVKAYVTTHSGGSVSSITASSPLTGGTITTSGTIGIPQSSASQDGYLSSGNWSTFNGKQDAITGGATTIVTSDLTINRALLSNASGKVAVSATTSTELGYISGVTSAIQTQLNAKQGSLTLTTTGSSGAATLVGSTLNIPQYSGGGSSTAVDQVSGWAALGGSAKGVNLANIQLRCTAANGFGTGFLNLQAIYLPTATTINGAFWIQATNGSYVANNYNGVGLYSYSGGTATLVASSTNDGTVFQSGLGIRKKAFSSTYSASAGVYYVGFLASWSSSSTNPNFWTDVSSSDTYWQAMDFTNSARYIGRISGQTSLPSSVALSSVSQVNYSLSALLY